MPVSNGSQRSPRVLVISGEPFSSNSATGITLSSFFRGLDHGAIFQLYSANVLIDENICSNYWKISSKDLVPFNRLCFRTKLNAYKGVEDDVAVSRHVPVSGSGLSTQILRRYAQWLDWLPYALPQELLVKINAFKPELIYTTLGSLRLVRLATSLSSRLAIPVVPHFLDDWLSTYDSSGSKSVMARIARPRLEIETRQLLSRVPFGMAISDTMSIEYSRRFSVPFETFVNPPDAPVGSARAYDFATYSKPLKLVYTGGLHLGRAEVLHAVAASVDRLARQGREIELSVYVPQKDVALAKATFDGLHRVKVQGNVPPEWISEILNSSDLAVHVESFQPGFKKYTRLSVSTKIPQYLASGLPVFACCPNDVASGQYIDKHNCGVVIGEESIDALESTLHSLLDQPVRMRSLSANAIRVASERHDGEIERLRFKEALRRAAGIGPDVAI